MILNKTTSSPIITSIATAPKYFKIKASRISFDILSGFYSEPHLAIPRELGANAWDAHVAADNTNTKFEVHAPNSLEPWFSVRDFGTGLSPDQIENLYTTYFDSTKTDDNAADGCMGLGSKTPFNYTDNFSVISYFNSKKYVYSCYIDENGLPNILAIAAEDTLEHNGLEIKFGVKLTDIGTWINYITRAYRSFRVRPIIKGATIEYPEQKYLYKGKKWAYRGIDYNALGNECNAFMGNYCYPISYSAIQSAIYNIVDYDTRQTITKIFKRGGFDFFFDVGELSVAPNKEQLKYEDNNNTSKSLISVVVYVIDELKDAVKNSIEIPATRWEALILYNKYNSHHGLYNELRNIIGEIPIIFCGIKFQCGEETVHRVHVNAGCIDTHACMDPFQLYSISGYNATIRKAGTYYPQPEGKSVIFYTNEKSIKKSRIHHYLKTVYPDKNYPTCYIISDRSLGNKNFFAHKKYFGWDDSIVKNIEALPKPLPTPRTKTMSGTNEIYYTSIMSRPIECVRWYKRSEIINPASTYYYVDCAFATPMYNGLNINEDVMADIIRVFVADKIDEHATVVYGINRRHLHILKIGKWINLVEIVSKHINAHLPIFEQQLFIKEYKIELAQLDSINKKLAYSNDCFINNLTNADTKKIFNTFLKTYFTTCEMSFSHYSSDFYRFFKITAKKHVDVPLDVTAFKNLLENKYMGIFNLVPEYCSNTSGLVNVINFIDEKS